MKELTNRQIAKALLTTLESRKGELFQQADRQLLNWTWKNMKQRCYNKKHPKYYRYGGRNIKVCEEWQSFQPFYEWAINNDYQQGLSLERINNEKGYSPLNCYWATPKAQARNRGNSVKLHYKGQTKLLIEWAEELKIPYHCIYHRIFKYHWTIDRALSTPLTRKEE